MSSITSREPGTSASAREIRFLHWPLRDQPVRSLVLLLAAIVAGVLVGRAAGNFWAGVAAWCALALCLWRMWLPVRFEFGPRGIVQTYLGRQQRISWRDVARCEFKDRGLLLHATSDTTAIGTLRSIYVRYPPHRDQLRELVEQEMARSSTRASPSSVETVKRNLALESDEGSSPIQSS